jgi:hypothetical protein
MRKDIVKIVREEARHGSGDKFANYRHKKSFTEDDSATRESMRVRYSAGWSHKSQHYSFTAVLNFIKTQVNKPWNNIYSEICESFPAKHYMRKKLDDYLQWEIEQVHYDEMGKPYTLYRWYGNERKYLADGHVEFYIDDKGILRKNKHYQSLNAMIRIRNEREKDKRLDTLKIIDKHNVLRKIGDEWYHFKIVPLSEGKPVQISYWEAKNMIGGCVYNLPFERIRYLDKLHFTEQKQVTITAIVNPAVYDEFIKASIYLDGAKRPQRKWSLPKFGTSRKDEININWWDLYQGVHQDKKAASHQLLKKHKII